MSEQSFDLWPGMCRKPTYGPAGFGSAYQPVAHDWRLLSREARTATKYVQQEGAPGYGVATVTIEGWDETWYCTRCRLVEVREVEI